MKLRTVKSGSDSHLTVEHFSYEDCQRSPITTSGDPSYSIYYILNGAGYLDDRRISGQDCAFGGGFVSKKPCTLDYKDGILYLPDFLMTLIVFRGDRSGLYRTKINVKGNERAQYCNIYYFVGNAENGYRPIICESGVIRHDPSATVKAEFSVTAAICSGDELVIGIGSYGGCALHLDGFSVTELSEESAPEYELFGNGSERFFTYTHPHAAHLSCVERTGEGFVLRPYKRAEFHADPITPWSLFKVSVFGEDAEALIKKHLQTDAFGIFSYRFSEYLNELCSTLFLSDRPLTPSIAAMLFSDLLCEHTVSQTSSNLHVERAKEYMIMNCHRAITVKEVAEQLHLSDRYLYNLFVKNEGISPKQYLNTVRMDRAKRLLRDRSRSISEIAAATGFPDTLSFSRFFSRHVKDGSSPSAYRKRHQ